MYIYINICIHIFHVCIFTYVYIYEYTFMYLCMSYYLTLQMRTGFSLLSDSLDNMQSRLINFAIVLVIFLVMFTNTAVMMFGMLYLCIYIYVDIYICIHAYPHICKYQDLAMFLVILTNMLFWWYICSDIYIYM